MIKNKSEITVTSIINMGSIAGSNAFKIIVQCQDDLDTLNGMAIIIDKKNATIVNSKKIDNSDRKIGQIFAIVTDLT